MYRENLELRIILEVFCRQLTVGEERETGRFGICAVCPSDFKTNPQTGSLDWARNRRLCGRAHSSAISRTKGTEGLHEHTVGQDHIVGQDPRNRTVNLRLIFVKSVWSG